MKARILLALVVLGFVAAPSVFAHELFYAANLDGPSEAPPNASPGTGFALVTMDLDLVTMRVQASFSGLTGTTSASHIHGLTAAPFTGTAPVATQTPTFTGFPLGVTAGTYDHTFDMTLASSYNASFITGPGGGTVSGALNAFLSGLSAGKMYYNIHSSTFPGGEIRGFMTEIPEPATCSMLVLAISGAALTRRRVA